MHGSVTPFFETEANPQATRRLLLVFFYFAPSAEVGALRWLSLSRFAAERGWAIDVVTLHPKFMGTVDLGESVAAAAGIRLFGFSGDNPAWYRTMLSAWRMLGRSGERSQPAQGLSGHLDRSEVTEPLRATTELGWQAHVSESSSLRAVGRAGAPRGVASVRRSLVRTRTTSS